MNPSRVYSLGVDFGTESARAVLVDISNGAEIATSVHPYEHGVMDEKLAFTGEQLPPATALQNPDDYLAALTRVITNVVSRSGVNPEAVLSLGIDTTACTLVLTDEDFTPLSRLPRWRSTPLAYARLWKHHAAQDCANEIIEAAQAKGGLFLPQYGGRISSEWLLPKALQTLREAPEVFEAATKILEQQDWIVSTLVGNEVRGASVAGFKGNHRIESDGYPSKDFLEDLEGGFSNILTKVGHKFLAPGQCAGTLTETWADTLNLSVETRVAIGNIDAHAAFLGAGATSPGTMVAVMGTSVCNLLVSSEHKTPIGIQGVVKDGIIPGLWAYEAGQAGFGDTFGWFARTITSADVSDLAAISGRSTFEILENKASELQPGETGLIILDWMSGNRSILIDSNLSGVILGLTLATRDFHIYRALLESAAFGQRVICDAFEASGIMIDRFVVCGGIPAKSPLLIQLLADITGKTIEVSAATNTSAIGAALHGAIAAGQLTWETASQTAPGISTTYRPNQRATEKYNAIYELYRQLHDNLGIDNRNLMLELRRIQANTRNS